MIIHEGEIVGSTDPSVKGPMLVICCAIIIGAVIGLTLRTVWLGGGGWIAGYLPALVWVVAWIGTLILAFGCGWAQREQEIRDERERLDALRGDREI